MYIHLLKKKKKAHILCPHFSHLLSVNTCLAEDF